MAIGGTRDPAHIDDAVRAVDLPLDGGPRPHRHHHRRGGDRRWALSRGHLKELRTGNGDPMSDNDTGNQQPGRKGLPTVAVLGIGRMGRPMATRLVSAGFAVRVWDRSSVKIVPLVDAGATAAVSPAQAAAGADVLLTMLSDGPAVQAVMAGADGPLASSDATGSGCR